MTGLTKAELEQLMRQHHKTIDDLRAKLADQALRWDREARSATARIAKLEEHWEELREWLEPIASTPDRGTPRQQQAIDTLLMMDRIEAVAEASMSVKRIRIHDDASCVHALRGRIATVEEDDVRAWGVIAAVPWDDGVAYVRLPHGSYDDLEAEEGER